MQTPDLYRESHGGGGGLPICEALFLTRHSTSPVLYTYSSSIGKELLLQNAEHTHTHKSRQILIWCAHTYIHEKPARYKIRASKQFFS